MVLSFEFSTAHRIVFGPGSLSTIGGYLPPAARKAFLVAGVGEERYQPLREHLEFSGLSLSIFHVSGEPTIDLIQQGVVYLREVGCDLVIGFGGGSAMDTAKAISIMATNPGSLLEYLEVIGENKPITNPPLPTIAIPTTAGTGSEVTRNAVLGSPENRIKVSMRSLLMTPQLAMIDPELTISLPAFITAYTGLDALTQVIEPFVSGHANPLTDALCREGIQRAGQSLLRAYQDGQDLPARIDMSLTSLFGGMALANAKLGAVHGIAGPFGGMFSAPHGAICGRLLPEIMKANLIALTRRAPGNTAISRYREVARLLTGDVQAEAEDGVDFVRNLVLKMGIPGLSTYGFQLAHWEELVTKSQEASSMKGNPIVLEDRELANVLERVY